jgi:general secretion pathway protein E
VLSSIHANDAVGVLMRLADLEIENFLIASSLIGVVAQRMVRRVCSYCAVEVPAGVDDQAIYEAEMGEPLETVKRGPGCNLCAETGYLGRIGVYEVLLMNDEIRRLLVTGATASVMREQAIADGMVPLRRDGMLKVKQGVVTPTEILRSVYSIT